MRAERLMRPACTFMESRFTGLVVGVSVNLVTGN